jgi:hypothetical protein
MMMAKPKAPPQAWKPGQSGNPKGKPPGSGELQKLRAAIGEHVPEIINQLVAAARGGDIQAARLILERVLPPVKAIEQAQTIDLPDGSLTDQGRAVLRSVAAGELAPGQGAQLLAAIGTLGKVTELDELAARVAALETKHGNT